jgi:hypothetical protein
VLSLLDSNGQTLGRLHLAGDASGILVNKLSSPGIDFVSINDGGNAGIGAGGNIPVTVIS